MEGRAGVRPTEECKEDEVNRKAFPTLYKKTSVGADQFWDISVEGNAIVTRWGQVDGKIQETRDVVKEGKNIGRSNATTASEQAELEAQSKWEHKLKKGYVKDLKDAQSGKVDSQYVEGGVLPMLAKRFDEDGHKISYPALAQPKFDGHRCIAMVDADGRCTLWTRSRKPITSMVHIVKAIEGLGLKSVVLDGELYNHDYKDRFEELTSFIRDSSVKPGAEVVQYHIYDVVSSEPQEKRTQWLHEKLIVGDWGNAKLRSPLLHYVETEMVSDEDHLMATFEHFLKKGYEGAMVRNVKGLYVNKRSHDLQKIKEFVDSEFIVVGVEEGRGKLAGHGIFVCATKDGAQFKAKMMGETSKLKEYWEDPGKVIGRMLTVKYQGLTKKENVPRFPVAVRFRDEL